MIEAAILCVLFFASAAVSVLPIIEDEQSGKHEDDLLRN